jgi:ATP-dependent RNA helicase RhlE
MQLKTFSELGLAEPILRALEGEGYTRPTPIQAKAIPIAVTGRDLLGIAQTGTGKTAAFALPIIHRLSTDRRQALRRGCRVLVLTPTRELAAQIALSFRTYGRHLGLTVTAVFGGVGHRPQTQALAGGVDVLVATPGRLIDHLGERNLTLAGTEILVLDEADQMLDLGFLPPIRRIVSHLSSKRQSLFFSATMAPEIGKLANELLRDPARVAVTPVASTVDSVAQRVIHVDSQKKRALLVELFADPQMSRALVFTRTKRGADRVARHLEVAGIRVAAIHGNKSQSQRERALAAFRASKIRALVATDIAARGIDIDQVTHVVNFELPDVPESYVHRIGRTARAGAAGTAISFCGGDEIGLLRDIERLTRQSIPAEDRGRGRGCPDRAPKWREGPGKSGRRSNARGRRSTGNEKPQLSASARRHRDQTGGCNHLKQAAGPTPGKQRPRTSGLL